MTHAPQDLARHAEGEDGRRDAQSLCETVVDREDFWVAGRTEPGIRAGLLDAAVFGRNEPAPQHLHQGFAAALRAAYPAARDSAEPR